MEPSPSPTDQGGDPPCWAHLVDEPDGDDAAAPAGGHRVRLRRAYEPADPADGRRVLVDRLWPRGVRREALAIDAWLPSVAPSDELRRWFGHDPARWDGFAARYRAELDGSDDVDGLAERAATGPLTLVYAAKDTERNNAVVLRAAVEERLARSDGESAPTDG